MTRSLINRDTKRTRALRVAQTEEFVRGELSSDSSGHDWWHVERVRRLSVKLAEREGADTYVVELAALLHDISDYKLNGGDHERGPEMALRWVRELGETEHVASAVAGIIRNMSFLGAGTQSRSLSLEGQVVQDADRLDAIGAIGIARAFAFGGYAGQPMHDPERPAHLHASAEEYLERDSTTINHFYEKLLLLKDRMNTTSARLVAESRHAYLEGFLAEFSREWDAADLQ